MAEITTPRLRRAADAPSPGPAAALPWSHDGQLLGVRVHAGFFDADAADACREPAGRWLPVFRQARPRLRGDEQARERFTAGELAAQPDAVFEHGNGLLCVLARHSDRRPHDPAQWQRQLRVDLMLQAVIAAMAVSGQLQRPTAALLRCQNVLYQFDPGSAVLECLASSIGAARQYWKEARWVSPAQLAGFCEPRLRALPGHHDAPLPSDDAARA